MKNKSVFFGIPLILVLLILVNSCKKTLPVASFTYSPEPATLGDTIQFQNTSQHAIAYDWEFGDRTTSKEENPTHVFAEAKRYQVQLGVSNEDGYDILSRKITIHPSRHE